MKTKFMGCGLNFWGQVGPGGGEIKREGKVDRHIEVRGRSKGQTTITVSRNEIIYDLNQADKFLLAVVIVDGDFFDGPFYIRNPFQTEPEFGIAGVNYDLGKLLLKAIPPEQTLYCLAQ